MSALLFQIATEGNTLVPPRKSLERFQSEKPCCGLNAFLLSSSPLLYDMGRKEQSANEDTICLIVFVYRRCFGLTDLLMLYLYLSICLAGCVNSGHIMLNVRQSVHK